MCAVSLSEAHTLVHISLFPLLLFVGELHAPASVMTLKMLPERLHGAQSDREAAWGAFF